MCRRPVTIHYPDGSTDVGRLTTCHSDVAKMNGLPLVFVDGKAIRPDDLPEQAWLDIQLGDFQETPNEIAERAGYRVEPAPPLKVVR